MSVEDTAAALAPAPEPVAAAPVAAEAPELSEDDALSAAYDRAMGGEPEEAPVEEVVAQEVVAEAPAEEVQAPTDMPNGVRQAWGQLTPEARDAVQGSLREMQRKLADAGRVSSGLAPIKDALINAASEFPNLANMRPEQVAEQVFELARVSRDFASKPLETMLGLIDKHGLRAQLAQALGQPAAQGQPQPQDVSTIRSLQSEVAALKNTIQSLQNPETLETHVSSVLQKQTAMSAVQEFASAQPYWGVLEPHMPAFVSAARDILGPGASAKDVLARAYSDALAKYLPDTKARQQDAIAASEKADPDRAAAVLKAKSVNVAGKQSGKTRVLTEDEALSAAYDRAASR
jgi:hypothetical protein